MNLTHSGKLPFDSDLIHQPYTPSFAFSLLKEKKEEERLLIRPIFHKTLQNSSAFTPYLDLIQESIERVVPPEIFLEIKRERNPERIQEPIKELSHILPLLTYSHAEGTPCIFSFTLLCSADFTSGVGRYMSDILCRWLIPGKFFNLLAVHSLNFHFLASEEQNFFIHQVFLEVDNEKEMALVQANLAPLMEKIRLNILAVKHARSVMAIKKLSHDEKKAIIQENLSSVIDRPSKGFDNCLFDQMHHFLIKLSAEEKITQIKEKFTPYIEQKPAIFDRDIYSDIQHYILLFRDTFTAMRELRHVGRLISFQYLFRKSLQREMSTAPDERHLLVKLMKTQLNTSQKIKKVLGVLIGVNVLRENELFEERHILSALRHCFPNLKKIKDSYVVDQRSHDKVRLFYLEVEKEDESSFTLEEIKRLTKQLPRELQEHFENVLHPVFMPRNEEEIIRNIVILSQQLKYRHDLPQVVISFDRQTEGDLCFTVILLRILHPNAASLKELFEQSTSSLKLEEIEVKEVGHVRKKYIKEANIFRVTLNKKFFLRKDYSLDLFKARQAVALELSSIVGEIRDFNGGIFTKQQEVLAVLKESLSETSLSNDFILEKFFYSLSPSLMRSILGPTQLKNLYLMLLESLETDFKRESFFYKTQIEQGYLWVMVSSADGSFKEVVSSLIHRLKIPSSYLTSSLVEIYGITCLGHIYRCEDTSQCLLFENTLHDALLQWNKEKK